MLTLQEIKDLSEHPLYKQYACLLQLNMHTGLQRQAKQWLEELPSLLISGKVVLKAANPWRDAQNEKPSLQSPDDYSFFLVSENVLVKTLHNEVMCAFYQEDEDGEAKWISACSEGWNITKSVTHWKLIEME